MSRPHLNRQRVPRTVVGLTLPSKAIHSHFLPVPAHAHPTAGVSLIERTALPPMHPPPDPDFLQACQRGDPAAQRQFYERHAPYLLVICRRYCRDRTEAVGILNRAMLRIFASLEEYREEGSLRAWLCTITRRTALNFVRDTRRADRRFRPDHFTPPTNVRNRAPETLAAAEILTLLDALPEPLKYVFTLHAIDGYTHAEIAEELGITVVNSRDRLRRARALLRDEYQSLHRINDELL